MMHFNPCAAIVLVIGCVVIATTQAASLAKIDCTKCRLDVYSFGSKDYDCGIARHNKLPICVVDCKILYNMIIPIPNLVLDFDLDTCVERSTSTMAPPTTAAPKSSTTASSSTLAAVATTATTTATTAAKPSTPAVATTTATTLATVIPEASATTSI